MNTAAFPFALRPPAGWLAALCLLAALGGCATTGGYSGGSATELATASDDSEVRKRARTRLALATGYLQNGKPMIALEEQKKAVRLDSSFSDAYALGGVIYAQMGEKQLAFANFERAISLNPRDANSMHNMGWMHCMEGNYPQAEALFARALGVPMYTEKTKTMMAKGVCEARAGNRAAAEATLTQAYELDQSNPVIGYNLANLVYQRGDAQGARQYIRRVNNGQWSNAETLWLGIKVERALGNQRAASELAEQLQRRYPSSKEARAYERGAFDE
ncbi:MAG: type IV pilus biogenesis/stability protein PilW [Ottowia sp.]|nr:type IV pilus biogenesis/stability protein PilW [Ottowia sp.]